MKLRDMARNLAGIAMGLSIVGTSSISAFATSPEISPAQQTIPVKAEITSYYIVSTPANLDGDGNLNLTREYNDKIDSTGETGSTFYGYTTVDMKGVIDETKKVHVDLTCADIVKTTDNTKSAVVNMTEINDAADIMSIQDIWAGENATVDLTSSTWTAGTTGIGVDFTSTALGANGDTTVTKHAMLRTTLPSDGTYTSNLVLDFAIQNVS